jgi:hypothetical protein
MRCLTLANVLSRFIEKPMGFNRIGMCAFTLANSMPTKRTRHCAACGITGRASAMPDGPRRWERS